MGPELEVDVAADLDLDERFEGLVDAAVAEAEARAGAGAGAEDPRLGL